VNKTGKNLKCAACEKAVSAMKKKEIIYTMQKEEKTGFNALFISRVSKWF
jgi:hypothetical protein